MQISQLLAFESALLVCASFVSGVVPPPPETDGKYTLEAEGIRAQFVAYGAGISNLFVRGKDGVERDVVVGFDTAREYSEDKYHDHFGGVPGRYANRIKNATLDIDGEVYKLDANEHGGLNTLHGGSHGWDYRDFTVTSLTATSITFTLYDPSGEMGFPGAVSSSITYTLTPYTWNIKMSATSLTSKTPIMLSSHVYWNLDGFQNPSTELATDHVLHLPYSGMRIGVDGILVPTGEVLPNLRGSVNDFWSAPKKVGRGLGREEAVGNCGSGCRGYDDAWLVDEHNPDKPVATLSSPWSGIKLSIYTTQHALQMYSCNSMNGTQHAYKHTQQRHSHGGSSSGEPGKIRKYGCIVLEVEDWIDAVSHPEWGVVYDRQFFEPGGRPYELEARYVFSVEE